MRLLRNLAAMVVLALSVLAPSLAEADSVVLVEPLKIKGLNAYAGRALSVFYVSGREAGIGAVGQTLQVRSVKAGPLRTPIYADGTAEVGSVAVPRMGFDAFNFVVFVVHSLEQPWFFLKNADGTVPPDPRMGTANAPASLADYQADRVFYLGLPRLEQIRARQGGGTPLVIDLLNP